MFCFINMVCGRKRCIGYAPWDVRIKFSDQQSLITVAENVE